MIRAVHTKPDGRKLLILGIDKTNVERLKSGQPILVQGDQMGLDFPIDVAITYGETLEHVAKDLREMGFTNIPDTLPQPVNPKTEVRSVTYISFAIPRKCLGVLILEGELSSVEAATKARDLKLHPGGQILVASCKETDPDVPKEAFEVMWANRDRLIPDTEACILFDGASIKDWEGTEVQN